MSKAILILDMPKSCDECDVICTKYYSSFKKGSLEILTKPSDCPLRELSDSKEFYGEGCDESEYEYSKGYTDGYNACIDDILKGSEEDG